MTNKLAVAGPNSVFKAPEAKAAGFWAGFWHGLIAPITLIVSVFNKDVRIYETNNTGVGYDVGFILGASAALGGKTVQKGPDGEQDEQEIGEAVEEEGEE
jgi:hypothetical protein